MASNHTQHYGLCQWEATDAVLRTDFNEDNQKIDTELKTQAGSISNLTAQMANKANTGAVSSLAGEVALKADQSDLDAEKAAREAADTANMETLRKENCWVKLSDETLSKDAVSYSYSVRNPELYAELKCLFAVECTKDIEVALNEGEMLQLVGTTGTKTEIAILGGGDGGNAGYMTLYPIGGSQTIFIYCEVCGWKGTVLQFVSQNIGSKTLKFNQLSSIDLKVGTGKFLVGSRFILDGLNK